MEYLGIVIATFISHTLLFIVGYVVGFNRRERTPKAQNKRFRLTRLPMVTPKEKKRLEDDDKGHKFFS